MDRKALLSLEVPIIPERRTSQNFRSYFDTLGTVLRYSLKARNLNSVFSKMTAKRPKIIPAMLPAAHVVTQEGCCSSRYPPAVYSLWLKEQAGMLQRCSAARRRCQEQPVAGSCLPAGRMSPSWTERDRNRMCSQGVPFYSHWICHSVKVIQIFNVL